MLTKISKLNQKDLRKYNLLATIGYFVFAFVLPAVYALCKSGSKTNEVTVQVIEAPAMMLIILSLIVICAVNFLLKYVDKIKTVNIDGTMSDKAGMYKSLLKFLIKGAVLIVVFVCAIYVGFKLKALIDAIRTCAVEALDVALNNLRDVILTYILLICHVCGFCIIAKGIDSFILDPFRAEIELREEVAKKQAINRRINDLSNLK